MSMAILDLLVLATGLLIGYAMGWRSRGKATRPVILGLMESLVNLTAEMDPHGDAWRRKTLDRARRNL